MNYEKTERAFELIQETEQARKMAIEELLAIRQDVDAKLKRLGHDPATKGKNPCRICGELSHDARAHRGEEKEKEKAPPKKQ